MQTASLMCDVPITVHQIDLDDDYVNKCINEIKSIGDQMNHSTNLKCLMTHYSSLIEHPLFQEIRDKVAFQIEFHPWVIENHSFKYKDLWGAIYYKGEGAEPHAHLPSLLSFCLYLKIDEDSSPLELLSDYNQNITFYPEKNGLIIFPAFVKHQVQPQPKNSERVIISGNVVVF